MPYSPILLNRTGLMTGGLGNLWAAFSADRILRFQGWGDGDGDQDPGCQRSGSKETVVGSTSSCAFRLPQGEPGTGSGSE